MRKSVATIVLASAWLAASCGRAPEESSSSAASAAPGGARGVVLIAIEEIRPDLLSTYGGAVKGAALDALAGSGVVFDDATTPCPMARPATSALLTGLAPDRSGVRDNVADRVNKETRTLAEAAAAKGFVTAAFVTGPFVSFGSGLERGFALFDGPVRGVVGGGQMYPPAQASSEAAGNFEKWLSSIGADKSFFAWVDLSELRRLPVTGTIDEAGKAYRDGLGKVDGAVGAIMAALERVGRKATTDVLVVGTHGTMLGEDGARGDSFWLRKETLRVPLIWAGPGAADLRSRGPRDARKVWLPDVAETIRALIGDLADAASDGRDLRGRSETAPGVRYAWTWATDDQLAWPPLTAVEGPGSFETFGWEKLKEVKNDPAAGSEAKAAASRPAAPRERKLSAETRRKLADAGVVLGPMNLDSPQLDAAAANALLAQLAELRLYLADQRGLRSAKLSRGLFDKNPDNFAAVLHRLLFSLAAQQDKMIQLPLLNLLKDFPERQESLHWVAHAALMEKQYPKAELLLGAAMEIGPVEPELLYDLACVRALQGDKVGALARFREAVDAGYRDWDNIEKDPDLTSIRSDPAYADVLGSHGR